MSYLLYKAGDMFYNRLISKEMNKTMVKVFFAVKIGRDIYPKKKCTLSSNLILNFIKWENIKIIHVFSLSLQTYFPKIPFVFYSRTIYQGLTEIIVIKCI